MISDYAIDSLLDHLFGGGDFVRPTSVFFALYSTAPNADGTGGVELSGNGYARVSALNDGTLWNSSTNREKTNSSVISFPSSTGSWLDSVAIGVLDSASGGNMLGFSWLYPSVRIEHVGTGDSVSDAVTTYSHGFNNDDQIVVFAPPVGSLPNGLINGSGYFVVESTPNTFKISTTQSGGAIDLTSTGGLIVRKLAPLTVGSGQTPTIPVNELSFTVT